MVLALLAPSALAHAEGPTPVLALKSPPGLFFDDPFAVRDDGGALAYLATDGEKSAVLHLQPLPAGADVAVPGAPINGSALHWLGKERVLVVARDADKNSETAQVFSPKGVDKQRLGPAEHITVARVAGKLAVITFSKSERGHVEYAVAAYQADTLRPLGKKVLREDKDGRVASAAGALRPMWWAEGYVQMAGLKAGEYDKTRDMRRPDRFTRLDVFTGRTGEEREIEDVLGFAHVAADHRPRDNAEVFVHITDDHKKLELVDGIAEHEVSLARPLWLYDPQTIQYQPLDGERLALSLTVDPVNPAAVKRQKADLDEIDVYEVNRKSYAATPRIRLRGEGRPSAWHIAGGRLALLRKGKGFDRGGVALEVYHLK
jgi:hypothetical protein